MVASALDVVSVERLREELRLGGTEQDQMLMGHIEDSVSLIEGCLGRPVVDRTRVIYVRPPSGEEPLRFASLDVSSVSQIAYFSTSGDLRDRPDGLIAGASLGRLEVDNVYGNRVYPPSGGWPVGVLFDSRFEVSVVQGMKLDAQNLAIRRAVIATCRGIYDGDIKEYLPEQITQSLQPWVMRELREVSRDGA